jgi:hypothetical protein
VAGALSGGGAIPPFLIIRKENSRDYSIPAVFGIPSGCFKNLRDKSFIYNFEIIGTTVSANQQVGVEISSQQIELCPDWGKNR